MSTRICVVGGGFAGVSAATALADRGFSVELLESKGFLGGRVYSLPASEAFPASFDNGPHLFMGCYQETLELFERLGVRNAFKVIDPLRITWLEKGGKVSTLSCPPLPAPFHLAFGFLTTDAFPWNEKIALAKGLMAFRRKPFVLLETLKTVEDFLTATRQGPAAREKFWLPFCNAVMNVPPALAPLSGLGEVLHRVFFGARKESALLFASKPLSELAFPVVEGFLQQRQGSVHLREGVQAFSPKSGTVELTGSSGRSYGADAVIFAVPPSSLASLWPEGSWPLADNFKGLGKSPIVSVHVLLSKKVLDGSMVGLCGARFDWVFNRNDHWDYPGEGQYLSFTASAADDLAKFGEKELGEKAMEELRERCPEARDAQVLHLKATKEMAATFRWTVDTGAFRPPCGTPFPNVFLAGDWTDTGLPATIEGACLSGHRAAEKVAAYFSSKT